MACILSIESSTFRYSVALHADGQLMAFEESLDPQQAASQLAVTIKKVLASTSRPPDAIAVASGPGSYTGLRIGVATAKGLCFATGARLLAVPTLELMMHQVHKQKPGDHWYGPMLDARRMEVYVALFDEEGHVVQPTSARIIDEHSFREELDQHPILFFGDGAAKCRSVIHHPRAVFLDDIHPQASHLGELAAGLWESRKWEDPQSFEPFYLKDFVAKKPKAFF
jgi:tRNA threonylcarbamoyladenosine biosynthesis protein TsaB